MRPVLLTFDVFGTVLDWRRGLAEAVRALGFKMTDADFDVVVDAQGLDESGPFRPYSELAAKSFVDVLGLPEGGAAAIAAAMGRWPAFPDSAPALRRLSALAPLAALTNSDAAHGADARAALGVGWKGWFCAEELRVYKPDPEFWLAAGRRLGVAPGKGWWHVSAYADYDLETAAKLGLTTVFVRRPHSRPGPADHAVDDLDALAGLLS